MHKVGLKLSHTSVQPAPGIIMIREIPVLESQSFQTSLWKNDGQIVCQYAQQSVAKIPLPHYSFFSPKDTYIPLVPNAGWESRLAGLV